MIRFGIVGAGGIAKKFARDLKLVAHAELTAVSARSLESAEAHKAYYQCKYAFGSYEDMAKSDKIDAVYIATPHRFHKEHAILFLKHRKHVLVEKPASVNADEFMEMKQVAEKNKVLLMEAMWTHFLPSVNYLLSKIKENHFGNLLKAKFVFCLPIAHFKSTDGRLLNPNLAGGSLLDLGIYPVSFISLLEKSKLTHLQAKASFTRTGVDKKGIINISEENGTTYKIEHSMTSAKGNYATFKFEKATVVMNHFHECQSLTINGKKMKFPYEGEGFVHEIRSFVHTIENKQLENQIIPLQKTLETMKLMDQIRSQIGLKFPFES